MNMTADQLATLATVERAKATGTPPAWAAVPKISQVMKATGCSGHVAAEYLLAEEGSVSDAVRSYNADSEAV